MTTAWEIKTRLNKLGKNVEFIGTGQTGILLSDGVAIDAVISDFVAGEVENLIDRKIKKETDWLLLRVKGPYPIMHILA